MDILDLYRYLFDNEYFYYYDDDCNCDYKIDKDDNCKCDIIDIAEEEMKNIDSSKIDSEFEKVAKDEFTKKIFGLVAAEKCTRVDIDDYLNFLNDDDILDIRVSGKNLFIKTTKSIIPITLANIMHIDEKIIQDVPVFGKYAFYLINTEKLYPQEETKTPSYDPKDLIYLLKALGSQKTEDINFLLLISDKIEQAFEEKDWEIFDKYVSCDIEDDVVTIAFDEFIFDAKHTIGGILGIRPACFIEVSGPTSTILLIDTRKWYLEKEWE